jgi:hypothetical protein
MFSAVSGSYLRIKLLAATKHKGNDSSQKKEQWEELPG